MDLLTTTVADVPALNASLSEDQLRLMLSDGTNWARCERLEWRKRCTGFAADKIFFKHANWRHTAAFERKFVHQ